MKQEGLYNQSQVFDHSFYQSIFMVSSDATESNLLEAALNFISKLLLGESTIVSPILFDCYAKSVGVAFM